MWFMKELRLKREHLHWFLQNRKVINAFVAALLKEELGPDNPYPKPVRQPPISDAMWFRMLVGAVEKESGGQYTIRMVGRDLTAAREDDTLALCRYDLVPARAKQDPTLPLEQKIPDMLTFWADNDGASYEALLPDKVIARNKRMYSPERTKLRWLAEKAIEEEWRDTVRRLFVSEFARVIPSVRRLMRMVRDSAVLEDVLVLLRYNATRSHTEALKYFLAAERLLLNAIQEQNKTP